jgi:phage shock protein A
MKRLTSFIVKTDPIDILELGIRKMESRLEKFDGCLSNLRGSEARLASKIDKNLRAANSAMKEVEYAKKQQDTGTQVYLMARQAGRLQRTNKTFADLLTQVRTVSEKLTKIFKNSKVVIEDTKNEVVVLKEEWEIKKQTFGALQSAMSIYNGDKDGRALFEEALEFISDDISNKTGQIEHMFSMSEDIMKSIDLQNGVIQQEGLEMLDEWEKNADGWLQTSSASPIKQVKGLQQNTSEGTVSSFSKLFNK